MLLKSGFRDCKQTNLTESKEAPAVSKKAPTVSRKNSSCKQKSSNGKQKSSPPLSKNASPLFGPPGQSTRDKETRGAEGAGGAVRGSK